MENVLREILKNNKYFEEINPDRYVPEFLGLIVNGVVVYHVNWIDIIENEIVFMHKDIQTHPIVSLVLENLNSLMIITSFSKIHQYKTTCILLLLLEFH